MERGETDGSHARDRARLRGFVAAGARHFACRIATTSLATQREQLEQLIKLKPMLSGE